ncbi:hypothetical protein STCU_06289 [Strigomonas culicis]|uniref:Dienelactone hydrolase domain-containing protein n=1 Tax=Strigomonas culicis TaxID=28005 RepID=S9UBS1_9TRYP|nr:hypothetical protein STCU_06289 [Strigomonas culicis]|eukprot:EPY26164.1 hypothetical protein STCU_06289 [Strigomonas culicis]
MSSDKQCCPTDAPPVRNPYNPTGDAFYMTGPIDSKRAVLIVGDIFGVLPNAKRYADVLAKEGYLVLYPDFMGDRAWDEHSWPPNFESEEFKKFYAFITDYQHHMVLARRACALLRRLGVEKIATIGMCWGARVAFDLAGEGLVEAASSAHPSRFTAEVMAPAARVPICVLPSKDENAEDMAGVEKAVNAHTVEPHVYKL